MSEDTTLPKALTPNGGDAEIQRCFYCGRTVACEFRPDPFSCEVHYQCDPIWICDGCYQDRLDEI